MDHKELAVSFSRDVYRLPDRPSLPEDWSIYYDCPVEYQKDGYFGAAYRYIGLYGVDIYIAHRGTDNLSGLIEDAEMKFFDKIPQQFYNGAVPFVQKVFEKLDQDYPYVDRYNSTSVYISFTGHSLGATLSELSIMRYVNYFNQGTNYNQFRDMKFPTDVFDSPGSADLVAQQLKRGEISQQDFLDGGEYIWAFNADVDAVNTCMETSSSGYINSTMSRNYNSLINGSKLPYNPGVIYYFNEYSVRDQHPIVHIYDWIMGENYFRDYDKNYWPIGFSAGYFFYKTYFASFADGLYVHNNYWEQYTSVYWEQNPGIHDEYDNDLWNFQQYYFRNVCYYYNGYALPKEPPCKFTIADMQRIARILSVEGVVMKFQVPLNHNKKEEKTSRACCGISFFPAVDGLQRAATFAAGAVDRVITETGEELERVISTANSAYQQGQHMFFTKIGRVVNGDEAKWVPSPKNQATFGMKK